jgi:hypothetical protein
VRHAFRRGEAPFAAALVRALHGLRADGTVSASRASELRRMIEATTRAQRLRVAFEPELRLGEFDALPAIARHALVDAIVGRERIELRGYELGPAYWELLRLLWQLRERAWASGNRMLRELSDVLAYGARKAPALAIGAVERRRAAARARRTRTPALSDVLTLAGLDTRDLAVCYARAVPQADAYRGYWHDASRQVTVGRVLGIDLLPGHDGWWFVESNAHPALEAGRSSLYEHDPMACRLFEFAERRGYRNVMVLDNTSAGIDPAMRREYLEQAEARRMQLTLPALPNVPGRVELRSWGIPPVPADGTLVARIRPYPTSLDHLLGQKRANYRALSRYLAATGDRDLRLPATGAEPVLGDVGPDEPFPNVVYKLPEIEQGRGVYFLKARSAEHARSLLADAFRLHRHRALQERFLHALTNKHGLYQEYVKSRCLEDGHLYKVRAMILLTPVGGEFLSAHRVVARKPLPARVEHGVVAETDPYLVNVTGAGRRELVPESELAGIEAAALAVARGFAWAVEYGFLCA